MSKKKLAWTILILSTLFLVSCAVEEVETPNRKVMKSQEIPKESLREIEPLQNIDGVVMFFDDKQIIYSKEIPDDTINDVASYEIIKYDLEANKEIWLSDIENVSYHSGVQAILNQELYIPISSNHLNILIKIDLNKNQSEIIRTWDGFPLLCYTYAAKNSIVLFGPNKVDEETWEYNIQRLDSNNQAIPIVIEEMKNKQQGTIIAAIDVEGNDIYAYTISKIGQEQSRSIKKYSIDGELLKQYPLDLKGFLEPVSAEGERDSVSRIQKVGNYFLLRTLNKRVAMFEEKENMDLKRIEIPELLYEAFPGNYREVSYCHEASDFLYFWSTDSQTPLIVFDIQNAEFKAVSIAKNQIDKAYSYQANGDGDILMREKTDSEIKYYIIDRKLLQ